MKKTLTIEIPDTLEFALEVGCDQPFALWEIVEQPLLYHWFDFAIDRGFVAVEIQTPAKLIPAIQTAVDEATLWPLEYRIVEKTENSIPAFPVSRLPQSDYLPLGWNSGSDLIVLKNKLTRIRLDYIWERIVPQHSYYTIGRNTYLHPDTILGGPYWIGNDCVIDEGAYIGPYTCIGAHTVLKKNVSLENSTIAPELTIQADLTFSAHDVNQHRIFNHQKNILHARVSNDVITPLNA